MSASNNVPMKPLIFCNRSVIAWQQGHKTQTRRLMRPQPPEGLRIVQIASGWLAVPEAPHSYGLRQPYAVGDLLWIREALVRAEPIDDPDVPDWILTRRDVPVYEADKAMIPNWTAEMPWTWQRDKLPAMFMPRWACRYYARVTSVRAERLQDISDEDAAFERTFVGQNFPLATHWYPGRVGEVYLEWWDSLHKKPGTWSEGNPWVWVYGLEAVDASTK